MIREVPPVVRELQHEALGIISRVEVDGFKYAELRSKITLLNETERGVRAAWMLEAEGRSEAQRTAEVEIKFLNDENMIRLRADRAASQLEADKTLVRIEADKVRFRTIHAVMATLQGTFNAA